jgi:hypothetical protein
MIPIRIRVYKNGVNLANDFLDFGIVYDKWNVHTNHINILNNKGKLF